MTYQYSSSSSYFSFLILRQMMEQVMASMMASRSETATNTHTRMYES